MAKKIKFVWVGKLKHEFWRNAAEFYWQLLSKFYSLQESCLKDGPKEYPRDKIIEHESRSIESKLQGQDFIIILDIKGKHYNSEQFAAQLLNWLEDPLQLPCFVIGGAYGLSPEIKKRSGLLLSLSSLTLPHELARVVLLEQLYRATTINLNHPYHH